MNRCYDWLKEAPSSAERDWSDQSIHSDTHLDRYINLDVAGGRGFVISVPRFSTFMAASITRT
ncbi:omptin family outer membrane protease [Mesorhizobium sp. B283B1A]|nr:omptin family outer membrane protease [Mesorhizobium sp. B283B1A]